MTAMVSLFFLLPLALATAAEPALETRLKAVLDEYRTACHAEGGGVDDLIEFSLQGEDNGTAAQ